MFTHDLRRAKHDIDESLQEIEFNDLTRAQVSCDNALICLERAIAELAVEKAERDMLATT